MEERLTKVETRLTRLVQALVPIERDVQELKHEVKNFTKFQSRLEGQLDLIKWLVVCVPVMSAVANAIITYSMVHGR